MDLDHLKKLVDACHDEAERTNDTIVSGAELDAYLSEISPHAAELRRVRTKLAFGLAGADVNATAEALASFALGHIETLTEQRDKMISAAGFADDVAVGRDPVEALETLRVNFERASEPSLRELDLLEKLSAALNAQREIAAERDRLFLLINTPRTDDFFEAVRVEAAHQVERWGVEHDAGKRPEDWITLFMYLLGKASKAHFEGNRPKLEHHVITAAAVALNWHRNMTGVSTTMRPGVAPRAEEQTR